MGAFVKLKSKGQLTIPKEIREKLDLATGTNIYVSAVGDKVVLQAKNKSAGELAGILGRPPSGDTLTDEQIDDAIGQLLVEDDERIMREWNEANK